MARILYTSTVAMKTSSCFSARRFLRISSVSTEEWQIYATKYPKILGLRRNLQHLIIWKRWQFLLAFLLKKLRPMHSNGETWCMNTSENLNNCQKTRHYPNHVLMPVSSLSNKDNTSILLIQKEDMRCNMYAENFRCLAVKKGLGLKDGFSRIRGTAQS